MSLQVYKTGIVKSTNFFVPEHFNMIEQISTTTSYTPSTGTNSCINPYRVFVPNDDFFQPIIRVKITVMFSGFDTSNTSGTFNMYWQGANYTSYSSSAAWTGTNFICPTLNNTQNLRDLVLSKSSGTYTYDVVVTANQTFLNSYVGSNIGIRSDYSNGTGNIAITDIIVTPEELSVSYVSEPKIKMRVKNDWIATHDYIEF